MVTTRGSISPTRSSSARSKSPSKAASTRSKSPTKRVSKTSQSSPETSPSKKKSPRKSIGTLAPELPVASHSSKADSSSAKKASGSASRAKKGEWSHTPSQLTLLWLAISLPLVIWDTIYVFLRPHTMTGGKWVWPFYSPYELYGRIDYVYGAKAWDEHNGFTGAQATLNAFETAAYLAYLYLVYTFSEHEAITGRGAPSKSLIGRLAHSRTLHGRIAAYAVLLAFGTSLVTFSKTVLYWLNEAWGGFSNIGHNSFTNLVFLWIIPNGLWIAFPAYMLYVFGAEILEGLELAAASGKKTR